MKKQATFRFYAELNDFLSADKRQRPFFYRFWGNPAVKDAIEALGVPHPEVDLILVNGRSVSFAYRLNDKDRVSVYPQFELLNIEALTRLRPKALRQPKFILDVNLGKLARKMRILGLDTLYENNWTDRQIVKIAGEEHRIILTRDQGLLKRSGVTHGYWVRAVRPDEQIKEVILKLDLFSYMDPFSRCSLCNGKLEVVNKKEIEDQLPARTRQYFTEFYRCRECGQIYWKGSHFQKMMRFITELKKVQR